MQEGQDRSGDQTPEYMGAWSPIPAGDQPDRAAGEEPAAEGSPDGQDEPPAEGTWIIPAEGDQQSGTPARDAPQDQPEHGLAGLGFGGAAAATPGTPEPGSAVPGGPQPPAAPGQGGEYSQPGGYVQPGSAHPAAGQPGQPGYGQPGHNQPTAAFG